jgi:hypothetical protein
MTSLRAPFLCALLAASAWASAAQAQSLADGPPQHRLIWRDTSTFRLNPIGLSNEARFTYRYRLYKSESKALRDNFLGIGIQPAITGAYTRLGVVAEVQPLSVLQLWALGEVVQYFGAAEYFQSFPDATSDYRESQLNVQALRGVGDPLMNYSTSGKQLTLGATLQMRFGPVVVRDQFRGVLPSYNLRAGDKVFYDIMYDVLSGNQSWFVVNDLDVLYQLNFENSSQLSVGIRWSAAQPFYQPKDFADNKVMPTNNGQSRVGPVIAYSLFNHDGAGFNSPTLLMVLNWYTSHKYRTGVDSPEGLPYIVVGLSFAGDFLSMNP